MYEDILQLVTVAAQKKNLKESTIHTYRQSLKHFFKLTGKSWKELTVADADDFLTAKRLAGAMPETYNHYYAALRFMYKRVLKLNWDEDEIPRMKRDRSLPTVLSREKFHVLFYPFRLYRKSHFSYPCAIVIVLSSFIPIISANT